MSLKIIEINPEIRKAVKENQGYCPCAVWKTDDTECMCKEFREQTTPGPCRCGLYEKVDDIPVRMPNCRLSKEGEEADKYGEL